MDLLLLAHGDKVQGPTSHRPPVLGQWDREPVHKNRYHNYNSFQSQNVCVITFHLKI